ncbi:MAG: hypothetical protein JWO62_311 [Acidimicrobiaceae bacterium]|jgi:hypothetical protein|nr:hypothetical protein [Acidimicrobiaceae bacterium]
MLSEDCVPAARRTGTQRRDIDRRAPASLVLIQLTIVRADSVQAVDLASDLVDQVNVALNEATLLGAQINTEHRLAGLTLSVLSLPDEGEPAEDPRVQVLLHPVGRVAASLRLSNWDDEDADLEPFAADELLAIVQRVGPSPIYGWEFLDVPEERSFVRWRDRLSLDWIAPGRDGLSHTLDVFQEAGDQAHLDIRFWFDNLVVRNPGGEVIPLEEFGAGGKRWWDALAANDPRTRSSGIRPLRDESAGDIEEMLHEL